MGWINPEKSKQFFLLASYGKYEDPSLLDEECLHVLRALCYPTSSVRESDAELEVGFR